MRHGSRFTARDLRTYIWFVQLLTPDEQLANFYFLDSREHVKEAILLTYKDGHEVVEGDNSIVVRDPWDKVCMTASLHPIWQQPIQML